MSMNNWIRCVVVYDDYSALLSVNYDKPCAENCRCQSENNVMLDFKDVLDKFHAFLEERNLTITREELAFILGQSYGVKTKGNAAVGFHFDKGGVGHGGHILQGVRLPAEMPGHEVQGG